MTDEEYARNIKAPAWPDRPGSPWPPGSLVAYNDYNENIHVNPPIWRRSGIFRTSHRPARGLPFLYYYAGIPGTMKSFLDRVFYSSARYSRLKVATSAAVVRRAGGVDAVHQLNNYLNLAQTVIPPSQYWTVAYGRDKGEVADDGEGMQTLVKNARAMAWLLKLVEAGKGVVPPPEDEPRVMTNFIR